MSPRVARKHNDLVVATPIRATKAEFLGWRYDVRIDKVLVAEFVVLGVDGGAIRIGEREYSVHRDGYEHGPLKLESNGSLLATGVPPTLYSRSFRIEHNGVDYLLSEHAETKRRFSLIQDERSIGTIRAGGLLSKWVELSPVQRIPILLGSFILFLVVFFWMEEEGLGAS